MNAVTENPLTKFDAGMLKGIETVEGGAGAPRALFQPQSLGEAMEIAKLMAAGNFVPPHLRGKSGDCLAVVMQAARWGLDPFAVGNKTYFVNDRMAYEAQLVIAVLNTSGVLRGRLEFDWEQTDTDLICTVGGTLKADSRPKAISQEFSKVKVKNSPLWQSSPRQQLGYYTARMWARLYAPEVLLGVYTVDEVQEMGADNARDVTPAAPTRRRLRKAVEAESPSINTIEVEAQPIDHDPATGEVIEEESEEENARRLDAETEAAQSGLADTVPTEPEYTERDWEPTLTAIGNDLDRVATIDGVLNYWERTTAMLSDAPESIRNRANGFKNARVAELKAGR